MLSVSHLKTFWDTQKPWADLIHGHASMSSNESVSVHEDEGVCCEPKLSPYYIFQ